MSTLHQQKWWKGSTGRIFGAFRHSVICGLNEWRPCKLIKSLSSLLQQWFTVQNSQEWKRTVSLHTFTQKFSASPLGLVPQSSPQMFYCKYKTHKIYLVIIGSSWFSVPEKSFTFLLFLQIKNHKNLTWVFIILKNTRRTTISAVYFMSLLITRPLTLWVGFLSSCGSFLSWNYKSHLSLYKLKVMRFHC